MRKEFYETLLSATSSTEAQRIEMIQSLWSGYGEIARYQLSGGSTSSVVVKNVILPAKAQHPRGWNTSIGHQRKVTSYEVEMAFYEHYASQCNDSCRVPKNYAIASMDTERLMVLEDLDNAGFALRKSTLTDDELEACLHWLANFHATFLKVTPEHLWPTGTYWHLDTRPEELEAMQHPALKKAAHQLDELLSNARYQTLVHGDAKVANFCFAADEPKVAAVDFQYVGGGCGMKDLAYFLGSCLEEQQCESREEELLDRYFKLLEAALKACNKHEHFEALQQEWRSLYPIAWTDFYRFLLGWMPNHWKVNAYSKRLADQVLEQLH